MNEGSRPCADQNEMDFSIVELNCQLEKTEGYPSPTPVCGQNTGRTVATKIIRPPVLKIFFDLYLLDEESYRALVFSVL